MAEYDIYNNPIYGDPRIKSIEWTGPLVNRDEDRAVFGAVGFLNEGHHAAGIGYVYRERGRGNRVSYETVRYEWQEQTYSEKGHAIFAAHKEVQRVQEYDRSMLDDEARSPDSHPELGTSSSPVERESAVIRPSTKDRMMAFFNRLGRGQPQSAGHCAQRCQVYRQAGAG